MNRPSPVPFWEFLSCTKKKESENCRNKTFLVFPRNKNDGKLQVSSSRPGDLKGAHSCLLFWGALGRLAAAGSFCLGAARARGEDQGSGHPAPSPPRRTEVVYYFLLRVARQSRGPALPAAQSARWESPPNQGPGRRLAGTAVSQARIPQGCGGSIGAAISRAEEE